MTDITRGACRSWLGGGQAFTASAVTWLAGVQGISQFLDPGCGLPAAPPVHEAARPGARVAYVDNDPVVAVHAMALLGGDPGVAVVRADVCGPLAVLRHPELAGVIDAGEPAGFVVAMVLHLVAIEGVASRVLAGGGCAW